MKLKLKKDHKIIKIKTNPAEELVCRTLKSVDSKEKREKFINEISDYISPKFKNFLMEKFLI